MSILQGNSCSITQESGEIWAGQTDLQQIHPKSDRLLVTCNRCFVACNSSKSPLDRGDLKASPLSRGIEGVDFRCYMGLVRAGCGHAERSGQFGVMTIDVIAKMDHSFFIHPCGEVEDVDRSRIREA